MNFCQECNNLLYPRENRELKRLFYACRNCAYQEEAKTPCVYVNQIKQSITANLHISRDTTLDPALKRTRAVRCPKCENDEACFFARSDEQMELVFVCTNTDCAFHWTQNQTKEKELEKQQADEAAAAAAAEAAEKERLAQEEEKLANSQEVTQASQEAMQDSQMD